MDDQAEGEEGKLTKCDKCGRSVAIGDWPWCPHEHVENFGEEPLEPYIDENLTREPGGIEITTRAQRRKIMYESNMEYRPKTKMTGSTLFFDLGGK